MVFYVDGSYVKNSEEKYQAEYAVITQYELLRRGVLSQFNSIHPAELFALPRACELAKVKSANIYTDSRYAFGVVHEFGVLWK